MELTPQTALENIANKGLASASEEEVVCLATAIWREGFLPEIDKLPHSYLRDAGYLLDRLTRFNVLKKEQKEELLLRVEQIKSQVGQSTDTSKKFRDTLAVAWGASDDYSKFRNALMPIQSRHYETKSDA